ATGATGATGVGIIPIYGSLSTQQGVGLPPTPGTNVDFGVAGPSNGVTPNTTDDSITVNSSGVYTISFSTEVNATGPNGGFAGVVFRLSINGIPDAARQIEFLTAIASINEADTLSRTDQLTLSQGDVIRVFIVATNGTISYANATLVITKIA
ncbi:exosporium leader peptide, partial [Priestia megaterium]